MVDYTWTDLFGFFFLNNINTQYIYFKSYGIWAKAVP